MNQEWKKLTRDLIVDLQKGLNYLDKDKSKRKIPKSKLKIITIMLRGYGAIDNLTLSSSEHIQQFYDAAEWFVRHQDIDTGGWPIPVKRKLASGFHDLQSGTSSSPLTNFRISNLFLRLVLRNGPGPCNFRLIPSLPPLGWRHSLLKSSPHRAQTLPSTKQQRRCSGNLPQQIPLVRGVSNETCIVRFERIYLLSSWFV